MYTPSRRESENGTTENVNNLKSRRRKVGARNRVITRVMHSVSFQSDVSPVGFGNYRLLLFILMLQIFQYEIEVF